MIPDAFCECLPKDAQLPPALARLHGDVGWYVGQCDVKRGKGWLKELALWLGRFPLNGQRVRVELIVSQAGHDRIWIRHFADHVTRSRISYDSKSHCVHERMGWLRLWMKPVFSEGRLSIEIVHLAVLGLPCPKVLLPRSSTVEWQDEQGKFRFDVSADMPFLGRLIRYHGWLTPDHANPF